MLSYRLLTILLVALLLPLAASAQTTFQFDPEHTEMVIQEPGFYQFHGELTNTSSVQDIYVVTRISVEMPEGWTNSLCTHHYCAPPFIDEVNDTLAPGGVDDLWSLDLQTTAEVNEGDAAVIVLRIASTNDPDDSIEQTFTLTYSTTSVGDDPSQPATYQLHPVYPNPFNAMSRVSFSLPEASRVKLVVMSVDGRIVETLADGLLPAGSHQRVFRSTPQMASGIYLVTLRAGNQHFIQRAVLLK